MPRQGHRGVMMEDLMGPTKIRKRGCSSSSSSSSRVYNYRLNKKAILVGKSRAGTGIGLGRSRSNTPVPTWRNPLPRAAIDSPKYSQSGKSTRPVSARKLAATLWEMNEMPSPKMSESNLEVMKGQQKKNGNKMVFKREKMQSGWGLHSGSGSLPPHLSDPSHSPTASEKMGRSSSRRRTPSISHRLVSADQNVRPIDSISNVSLMEVETRSRPPTSSGSVISSKNRLKDVSNALTTSKELLKIINRIWARSDQPSSSAPLVSALHVELERARLHVNHLIHEQRPDKNDINYLMKCFADEKASWKNKEQQAVEAAVGPIFAELDVERKLRRRLESLNKKLGKELSETKSNFIKAVEELESEKRDREITEEVCNELARNIDKDRAEVEKMKRESVRAHEEVEKEREMLELADKLREERVQMKLSEAKYKYEEKNSAVSKLRRQLEVFLRKKRDEEVEDDAIDGRDDSSESDLNSIQLNMDRNNNSNKGYKWKLPVINEMKARNSVSGPVSRRSGSLQRSVSDGEFLDGFNEPDTKNQRSSCYFDETQRHKAVKGLKDHILSSSRLSSPSLSKEQSWPSRDPFGGLQDRTDVIQTSSSKSKIGQSTRRSKW
ncbi:hypothetical protein CASFOL_027240 [Castilleja foliolosa]|uniref:Uncharacterized protein n=1 Tax=Castilleja foliolosa TaxID=1961234 RepID=A0ABD3CFT1_9LAMI